MTQLEFFDTFFDIVLKQHDEGLECNKCGLTLPLDNFNSITYASGTVEYKRICRTCARNQTQVLTHLKNTNAYPSADYVCPICQRDIAEIGRNTGLGAFKDDINRIRKAVEYIQKHEDNT